ncbi:MAG: PDZ domain-containing protein [Myxococcota bacterium]
MKRREDIQKLAEALGGIAVFGCIPDSPAARAGVQYGDILLAVDGHVITSHVDYVDHIRNSGDDLSILVFRNGEEVTLRLDMTERVDLQSKEAVEYISERQVFS